MFFLRAKIVIIKKESMYEISISGKKKLNNSNIEKHFCEPSMGIISAHFRRVRN